MGTQDAEISNRNFLTQLLKRFNWVFRLRPAILGALYLKIFAPGECRRIVSIANGMRLFINPFSDQGRSVIRNSATSEPDTESIFRSHIKEGDVVLDLGANEGVMSALAGILTGSGLIIAVEPQSALIDIIEINFRINNIKKFKIFMNAFGGTGTTRLNISHALNTGASSIVAKYRFSGKTEEVSFISIEEIMELSNVAKIDFVKMDLEGFEAEAVDSLIPAMEKGKIKYLFMEYHEGILKTRGISVASIHNKLVASGMHIEIGNIETSPLPHILYKHRAAP